MKKNNIIIDKTKLFPKNSNESKPGIISNKNPLNDLSGKEWIYRTNSIESFESTEEERKLNQFLVELIESKFSTNGEEGFAHNIRKVHPSPKPPQLMKLLIEFFSKKNEIVFDPFMGVGGALLACSLSERKGIGLDLSKEYIEIYKKASKALNLNEQISIVGNSKDIKNINELRNIEFDLILTDPPYGNMMARKKTGEAAKKKKDISPTPFTDSEEDIGNLPLAQFLNELKIIIEQSFYKLKNKKYVIVFTKDFQPKPDFHGLLHYEIVKTLTEIEGLYYKGLKIWYDKTINLYPYGYPYAYVGNQLHQYILVFRKEIQSKSKRKK